LELNELLLWIGSGLRELTVREMEAVLEQRRPPKDQFLTLEERIKQVYGTILDISPAGSVIWRSPSVAGCIPERKEADIGMAGQDPGDEVAAALDIRRAVLDAEESLIGRILGAVFPSDNANETGLALKQLLQTRRTSFSPIGKLDPLSAHLEIALACLKTCKSGGGSGLGVLSYARMFFFDHLQEVAKGLSAVAHKTQRQQKVGPLILDLFSDDNAINAMFWCNDQVRMSIDQWALSEGKELDEVCRRWLYKSDGVALLETLFQDQDWPIWKPDDKAMLAQLFPKGDSAIDRSRRQRVDVLGYAAERIARNVLLARKSSTRAYRTSINFLSQYLSLVRFP